MTSHIPKKTQSIAPDKWTLLTIIGMIVLMVIVYFVVDAWSYPDVSVVVPPK